MRILTYNIKDGGKGRENIILDILSDTNADVIVLQEVTDVNLVYLYADALKMYCQIALSNSNRKLAILSKNEILRFDSFCPAILKHTLLEASIKCNNGHVLNLFGLHLAPYPFFVFEEWRLIEIFLILRRIRQNRITEYILCGDFNSISPQDEVDICQMPTFMQFILWVEQGKIQRSVIGKILSLGLTDCYRHKNRDEHGFTLPSYSPHVRLDYFFSSQYFKDKIIGCHIIENDPNVLLASDHLPLILDLDL